MNTKFYMCKCFLSRNIYVKDLNSHFHYICRSSFLSQYSKVINQYTNGCQQKIEDIINVVENEVERRKSLQNAKITRKTYIKEHYKYLHFDFFTFGIKNGSTFDAKFLNLINDLNFQKVSQLKDMKSVIETHPSKLYSFPLFNDEFCEKFLEEINNFENSPMPKGRPNTMNRYGVNLDELGFDAIITDLVQNYLLPLTNVLFPEWGGGSIDSHKAFVVKYKQGEDVDLGYHYDNAEITLNVPLNDNYKDGELVFGPIRFDDSSIRFGYEHQKGFGLLHRGQQLHEALPITTGERYNLIIWLRSSKIRNHCCPMCDKVPSLLLDDDGMGDGFTSTSVNLCTAL